MRNRFINNTSWILTGQILRLLISLFVSVMTARYLGPSNNGILNYVNSYIAFFTAVVGLGLNGVIIYEFVNYKEEGKILGTAILLRLIAGIVSFFTFLSIIYVIEGRDEVIVLVAFLQAIQLPFLCLDTVNYWYQYKMQSKYSALAQTIAYAISALYKVILLIEGKGVVWFAFAISLDFILLGGMYLILYSKHRSQNLDFSFDIAKRMLRNGWPFVLANIMVVIYGQMDKVMIKTMLDSTTQVGLYSAAIAICSLVGFIPTAILDSARPLVAEAQKESNVKFELRFTQLVWGILWICFAYSVFITFFSRIIIYLMYGSDYLDADVCLKIAVWYTAFSYLGSARSFWLICENKKNYVFIFSLGGAICNVILNLLFIPIWGINGAAFATLITQVLTSFVFPLVFKDTRAYGKCVINALFMRNIDLKQMLIMLKQQVLNRKDRS